MDFMMPIVRNAALALLLSSASVLSASAQTPLPDAIAAPGETVVLTLHAEGAQIYECKAGTYESVPYSADYVFLRKG